MNLSNNVIFGYLVIATYCVVVAWNLETTIYVGTGLVDLGLVIIVQVGYLLFCPVLRILNLTPLVALSYLGLRKQQVEAKVKETLVPTL
jgi:hypothetical protein